MSLKITNELIERINQHIEAAYPGEGAGFLLGTDGDVNEVLPLDNAREEEARHNRFLLTPEDYLKAEMKYVKCIRANEVVLTRENPSAPDQPPLTRTLTLRSDEQMLLMSLGSVAPITGETATPVIPTIPSGG